MIKIEKYLKELNIKPIEIQQVPESYSSEVYLLILNQNQKFILKIPYNQSKYKREIKILKLLEGKLPVPKIINHYFDMEDKRGVILLSYIDGVPINKEIDDKLAFEMGNLLAKVHSIKMPYFNLNDKEEDWDTSIKTKFDNWILECRGNIEDDFLDKCKSKFNQMSKKLPKADGPCLVHFDYRPGNILIKDNKIVGLIDFESSRGGAADIDFTKMKLYVFDRFKNSKKSFVKGYESIRKMPNIDIALPFYLFFNGVGGLAWCVRRNEIDKEFFIENYNQVKEILREK